MWNRGTCRRICAVLIVLGGCHEAVCRCWPLACLFHSPLVDATQDPKVTPELKDPPARKVLKAFRASQAFKVLRVLKVPKGPRALPARRVTREIRAKLQP
jgi:hypothetical protein